MAVNINVKIKGIHSLRCLHKVHTCIHAMNALRSYPAPKRQFRHHTDQVFLNCVGKSTEAEILAGEVFLSIYDQAIRKVASNQQKIKLISRKLLQKEKIQEKEEFEVGSWETLKLLSNKIPISNCIRGDCFV